MVPFGHAMDGWKSKLSRLRVLNNEFHPTLTIFWWADVAKCWSRLLHASFSLVINSILSVCDCTLPNTVCLLLQDGRISCRNSVNTSSLHRKRMYVSCFHNFYHVHETFGVLSGIHQDRSSLDLQCWHFFFLASEYDILFWFMISKSVCATI